ncbi:MAG: DUF58 domain-containing protein [Sandaracinus sp.]
MSSLLEPAFLRRLGRLRLAVRRRFAGSSAGGRRSLRRGSSAEFAEHRPYYAGDDVRRIDWNAYARLEELVLRLFVAEEDLCLYLLVDRSASLGVGAPPKIELAKQVAAALGYVGLSGSERVSVHPYGEELDPPMAATRGRRRIGALLRYLDAIEARGDTDLTRTVERFLARSPRPGLVAVISDFFDPGGFQKPLDRLLAQKFEPVLFQVLDREELHPTAGQDVELLDAETGQKVEVSLDERAIAAYRARLYAFFGELEGYAKKRGLFYGRIDAEHTLDDVVVSYLREGAR